MKKKNCIKGFIVWLLAAGMFCSCQTINKEVVPGELRTEYLSGPIGLDTPSPRFTWNFSPSQKEFSQSYYQIHVATSAGLLEEGKADVWDSDKLEGTLPFARYTGTTPLESHRMYYWNVTVWDASGRKTSTSQTATFEMAKINPSDWQAKWITDKQDKEFEPAPLFRKTFSAKKPIASARAYVSAAGYAELFINGKRVGENFLDPGYTHFDKRLLYVTHDITPLLTQGENAVGAVLGNGWYNIQSKAVWDFEKARWRDRPRFLCELRITYADGSSEVVATDDSWRTSTGPYTYNNLYSGDMYDARLEQEGWNTPTFNDASWTDAVITSQPAPLLVAQTMPGIRITEEVKASAFKTFSNKLYVYSFPKNMAGVTRLKVKGKPGTRITVKHGELLKKDGRLEQGNINVYYHPEKAKEVFQMDVYTLKGTGEEEVFMPHFCYHGFQYAEVESSEPVELTDQSLTALFMHTALDQVGEFSSSNELLNKIWTATNQAYRSNIHSIPTDCPQREKNGWTADAHVAIDLALLNFDGITLYEKWMNDFIDNQRDSIGDISGIIPSSSWGYGEWIGPVWDAALFIIPNALCNYYGDTRSIEKLYPTMERYLKYLSTREKDGYLAYGLGDWVFYKTQTPNEYTSTAYYYLDYTLMARFASLLGKDATHFQQKADQLKTLINTKYFNPETGIYANGSQTAQALALYLGLVPEGKEQLVADKLLEAVKATDHFLDFGLLGSKTVPAMLTRYGYVEDAYRMITKTEAPSWGYFVQTMGYTTLPETWTMSPEFRDASLNHVFMGDVSAWMYNCLAGINYDADQPGFAHVVIRPYFVKDLQWVKGSYKSVKGLIRSEWKRDEGNVKLTVEIPAGTTATVYADKEYRIGSGIHSFVIKKN